MKVLISTGLCIVCLTLFSFQTKAQNSSVAIGDATPKSNAVLYLKSTGGNQGLIIPVVPNTGTFGEAGMIVYSTNDQQVHFHDGNGWNVLGGSGGGGGSYTLSILGNNFLLKDGATTVSTVPLSSAAPAPNQLLMWDGTKWIATTQDLSLNSTTNVLSLTNDGTTVDLSAYKQTLAIAGNSLSISGGNAVTLPASGSGVTSVTAGTGLTGGTITTTGTINVDVGTGANKIVQLDPTGKLPAIDGSQLTNLPGGGSGTVTNVSVTTASGVSGTVANPTTTPAITLSLGAITPTSVTATGAITGSNLSGTNTGDQINITGNAATVTTNANLTGPVSSVGNATTIGTAVVANSMLTNVPTATFKGRTTAGPGVPEDLTVAQAKSLLNLAGNNTGDQTLNSLLPSQAGNNGKFLTTDATNASWASIPGGGDMLLGTSQTVTGNKIYTNGTLLLRNTANTFNGVFANTNTADRTYTLKDANGTIAFTSDITGTNSGINTGDQTTITGNAGTATALQTGRTISLTGDVTYTSPSFNGTSNVTAAATVARINGNTVPANASGALTNDGLGNLTWTPAGGGGTVTSVSIATANGVSGTVATPTSTPAITLTLGAITPTSVAASGAISGSNLSGTNTGDQINISGNAGTATSWTTARLLAGNSVNGTANVPFANKFIVQGTADAGLSGAQFLGALPTGLVKNTTTTGVLSTGVAGTDYVAPSAYASTNGLTMSTARLLGRTTTATGPAEEISIGANLSMTGGVLSATGGMTNPLTTTGDIIYGVGATPTRLAGAAGVLKSTGAAAPSWGAVTNADITSIDASKITTGILPVSAGGTGRNTWDGLLIGDGAGTINDISNGTAGQVLTIVGTTPSWQLPASNGWSLTGNAGTTPATNFLGTTDAQDVVFKANSVEAFRIGATGNIGIGTTTPSEKFSVVGNVLATGTLGTGSLSVAGAGTRMFFYPAKAAFRAGQVIDAGSGEQIRWDDAQIGNHSFAGGLNTLASGASSFAMGDKSRSTGVSSVALGSLTVASRFAAFSMGYNTQANGEGSAAFGRETLAEATASFAIGRYNVGGGDPVNVVATDPLFEIGNGTSNVARNNALTVLKNGNVGLGIAVPTAKLDIVGAIKIVDGTQAAGRVLTSNGAGLASWQPAGAGSGWTLTGNAGTTFGTNFIGTTDNIGLSFKTNNLQRMYINGSGQMVIDINNTNPIASPVANAILDIVPSGAGIGNIVLRGSFANPNDPTDIEFRNWGGGTVLGAIAMSGTGQDMIFSVAGTTRMTLENAGAVNFSGNTMEFAGTTVMNNTGTANIFVGGNNASAGSNNAFFGVGAGAVNTAIDNTFIGRNAGLVNAGGTLNVMVGSGSGQFTNSGSSNTFVGYRAGFTNTTGVRNIAIGREADVASVGLTNAIAIGYQAVAGASNTMVLGGTGANAVNVGIGTSTPNAPLQFVSATASRKIVLFEATNNDHQFLGFGVNASVLRYQVAATTDAHVFYAGTSTTTSNELMRITGTGLVGIGRTPTTNQLEISGNASKAAAGGWLANSDRRIKTDILDIDNSLELIMKVRPVKYKYTAEWMRRNPSIKDQYYYSFIAQEYQKVFPEAVQGSGEYLDGDKNEILQIDTHNAQIVTIKAVQEQQKIIETQQNEIDNLKKELAEIKNYLSMEAKVVKKKKGRK